MTLCASSPSARRPSSATRARRPAIAFARLAETLRHSGAPEAEQLSCLTDAIKGLSASVGPSHERTTDAFAQLAHVALNAQAVEVAVTAGMQALGGLQTRGEGESAAAGEVYATLAMAAAARQSPAALGAAERAHTLTAGAAERRPRAQAGAHRLERARLAAPPARHRRAGVIAFGVSALARRRVRARRRRRRSRPAQPRPASGGRARVSRRDRIRAVRVARVRGRLRGREPHRRRCRAALPGHA